MDEYQQLGIPADLLTEGVAALRADGVLEAQNDRMRAFLRRADGAMAGTLLDLGLRAEEVAQMHAGSALEVDRMGWRYRVRLARHGEQTWLFAETLVADEAAVQLRLATARCRTLGGLAAAVMHDLANLLAAGMGIGEVLRVEGPRPEDLAQLDDLMASARQGITLGRGLARMLTSGPRTRRPIRVADLVDEVAAVLGKHCSRRGVELTIAGPTSDVTIRFEPEVATQILLHAVLFGLDHKAHALGVRAETATFPMTGGRSRAVASVIVAMHGLSADIAARVQAIWDGAEGSLHAVRLLGENASGLMLARLLMAAGGGELTWRQQHGVAEFVFCWPSLPR